MDTPTYDALLADLHRKLVAIYASLAEHGPTDPQMVLPHTLSGLREVLDTIRAARKDAAPTSS